MPEDTTGGLGLDRCSTSHGRERTGTRSYSFFRSATPPRPPYFGERRWQWKACRAYSAASSEIVSSSTSSAQQVEGRTAPDRLSWQ
jgi:hypothetical protein